MYRLACKLLLAALILCGCNASELEKKEISTETTWSLPKNDQDKLPQTSLQSPHRFTTSMPWITEK